MKAVIVEKHDGFSVALRDDGCFVRVKGSGYEIGDQITLRSGRNGFLKKVVAAAAAVAVMVTAGGVGTNVYFAKETYSVVSMDINPSIEYSLNRFDKVIAVRGVNSEGEQIAGEISDAVISGDLSNALHTTFECLCEKSYITADESNYMIIGVYSKSAKKQESIGVAVAEFSVEETELCTVTTVNVTKEEKEVADSLGITAGKMVLAVDAATAMGADTTDADITELAALSVEELTNIAAGNETIDKEPEQVVEDKTEPQDEENEPQDIVAVSDNSADETVSGDQVAEVETDDETDVASVDKSDDEEYSENKGSEGTVNVSKDKAEDEVTVSGDSALDESDSDQSSSKKDDVQTAVSSNTVADDSEDPEDMEADAVSGSKKGDATDDPDGDTTGDAQSGESTDTGVDDSEDDGVSVSKPKSSQLSNKFESGNNISITDSEKTVEDDSKI